MVRSYTAITTKKLQSNFIVLGLPEALVSDNRPAFCSDECKNVYRVQHILTTPYHPASNGLAKCYVQMLKDGMKKVTGKK